MGSPAGNPDDLDPPSAKITKVGCLMSPPLPSALLFSGLYLYSTVYIFRLNYTGTETFAGEPKQAKLLRAGVT